MPNNSRAVPIAPFPGSGAAFLCGFGRDSALGGKVQQRNEGTDRTGCEQRLYCRGLHSWGALRACAQSGVQEKIMNVFSCITLGIGVTMLSKGDSLLLSCFPCCSERRSAS